MPIHRDSAGIASGDRIAAIASELEIPRCLTTALPSMRPSLAVWLFICEIRCDLPRTELSNDRLLMAAERTSQQMHSWPGSGRIEGIADPDTRKDASCPETH
ncbi:MAG: hypothetical protein DSY92_08385 [Planctomycetota bacterium]|nr:MAG: hypothetical protein DSY92_08385 [Planctomycetota bacterium]